MLFSFLSEKTFLLTYTEIEGLNYLVDIYSLNVLGVLVDGFITPIKSSACVYDYNKKRAGRSC